MPPAAASASASASAAPAVGDAGGAAQAAQAANLVALGGGGLFWGGGAAAAVCAGAAALLALRWRSQRAGAPAGPSPRQAAASPRPASPHLKAAARAGAQPLPGSKAFETRNPLRPGAKSPALTTKRGSLGSMPALDLGAGQQPPLAQLPGSPARARTLSAASGPSAAAARGRAPAGPAL